MFEIEHQERHRRYHNHPAAPTTLNKYQIECLCHNLKYLFSVDDILKIISDGVVAARIVNVIAGFFDDINKVDIPELPTANSFWAEAPNPTSEDAHEATDIDI